MDGFWNLAPAIGLFVREHHALLTQLSTYTLIAVRPAHISDDARCVAAWDTGRQEMQSVTGRLDPAAIAWYFAARRRIEQGALGRLSVADIDRYRACRTKAGGRLDALYSRWVELGTPPLETVTRAIRDNRPATESPRLVVFTLPHRTNNSARSQASHDPEPACVANPNMRFHPTRRRHARDRHAQVTGCPRHSLPSMD